MAIALNATTTLSIDKIAELLGDQADTLLNHVSRPISKDQLYLPGPNFVSEVYAQSDRPPQVLRSLQQMFNHGRLAGTGYLPILPVDRGIEQNGQIAGSGQP